MNQLNRRAKHRRHSNVRVDRIAIICILLVAIVFAGVMLIRSFKNAKPDDGNQIADVPANTKSPDSLPSTDTEKSDDVVTPSEPPVDNKTEIVFNPHSVEGTRPEDFGMETALEVDGQRVANFSWDEGFNFGTGEDYTDVEGVISFHGNNFRDRASFGNIGELNVVRKADGSADWDATDILEKKWNIPTYSLTKGCSHGYSGAWTGSGWSGQPIIVKWDKQTKQHMNMFDWAKEDDDLVEVIYATMDGCIYFIDLDSGNQTRNKMNIGVPFKGAGSLDPRGYPLLYLGSGDSYDRSSDFRPARGMVVDLINCKIIYEFGQKPDDFGLREWTAYDSSALVCEENDCLIYPGENGVLYVQKMNTQYNAETGEVSVNPSKVVKFRYSWKKSRDEGHALGYEASAAAYSHYGFFCENSGLMHCIDLDTMSVVWAQEIIDDTNSSPVINVEDGKLYLYVGNTLDATADSEGKGTVSFFKIDAETGKIVWRIDRELYTTADVTGGIMSTAIIGKNNMEGRLFITFASYSNKMGSSGKIACIDIKDGSIIWEGVMRTYSWSSPVAVYDENGNGYIVQTCCGYGGCIYIIDGASDTYEAAIIDKIQLETSNIEASPAVYNDTIVIGTRTEGIYGISIKSK